MQFRRLYRTAVAVMAAAAGSYASEIGLDDALVAAENWAHVTSNLQGERVGTVPDSGRTVRDESGSALFHVVRMKGGGVVVLSAESRVRPVIAFSSADDIDESTAGPLGAILDRDLRLRMLQLPGAVPNRRLKAGADAAAEAVFSGNETEWASLLVPLGRGKSGAGATGTLSDTRVAPLVKSEWSQSSVHGSPFYNKYTPRGYPCGCVATAYGQIMLVHRYPVDTLPARDFNCYVDGSPTKLTAMPGKLDWANMPYRPASLASVTEAQSSAVGRLLYNVGVACEMMYDSGGSGATLYSGIDALTGYFGYASAKYFGGSGSGEMKNAILASLDYGKPVALSYTLPLSGHAVVGDGYGFNGETLYVHINMGWSGKDDMWYTPVYFDTADGTLSFSFDAVCYNIMPEETGEVLSGRVLSRKGDAVADMEVKLYDENSSLLATTNSNSRGIYAFLVEPGRSYSLKVEYGQMYGSASARTGKSYASPRSSPGNRWGVDVTLHGDIGNHTVTFDPNGGDGDPQTQLFIDDDKQPLATVLYTREGHVFRGWASSPDGEAEYFSGETVSFIVDTTLYAVWTPLRYRIMYAPGSGAEGDPVQVFKDYDVDIRLEEALYGREFYVQTGWATHDCGELEYGLGEMYAKNERLDLFPSWEPLPEYISHVSFDANGGEGTMERQRFVGSEAQSLSRCGFTREGYSFLGWATSPDGPAVLNDGESFSAASDLTLYAVWKARIYTITYYRGRKGVGYLSISEKTRFGEPYVLKDAVFTRAGYRQTGWATADGGESVYAFGATYTGTSDLALYPAWERAGNVSPAPSPDPDPTPSPDPDPTPSPDPDPAPSPDPDPTPTPTPVPDPYQDEALMVYPSVAGAVPAMACEYNGGLFDDDGNVAGTIKVKVSRPNKSGLSSVKATVTLGGRKTQLKPVQTSRVNLDASGPKSVPLAGGETCSVRLGANALGGEYDVYRIDGSRDVFKSKVAAERSAAAAAVSSWTSGPFNIVSESGVFSVKISSAGKAKVKGTLQNGTKVSASAPVLIGEKRICVPVLDKKKSVSFSLWLPLGDGGTAVAGLGGEVIAAAAGTLVDGASFRFSGNPETLWAGIPGTVLSGEYLPVGVKVTQTVGKWSLPPAGKVVYRKGTAEVDRDKLGGNPAALKLTYKPATASFSGSFKVYADENGTLKTYKASVTGVLVGGKGYGTALIKGRGSAEIEID